MGKRMMDERDESKPLGLALDLPRHGASTQAVDDDDGTFRNRREHARRAGEIGRSRIRKPFAELLDSDVVIETAQAFDDVLVVDVAAGKLPKRSWSDKRDQLQASFVGSRRDVRFVQRHANAFQGSGARTEVSAGDSRGNPIEYPPRQYLCRRVPSCESRL